MLIPSLVQAVTSLDIMYFYHLLFGNLFWLFAFAVVGFYFFEKKSLVWAALFAWILVWIALDFSAVTGLIVISSAFLCFHYIFRLGTVMFAESIPSWRKHMAFIVSMQFIIAIIIYNYFIVGWF